MTSRRLTLRCLIGVTAIAVALAAGAVLWPVVSLTVAVIWQSLNPATVSWESKGAYVKCEGAIADPSQWPKEKAAKCRAMQMCANEAVLGERERRMLGDVGRKEECEDL